MIAHYPFLFQKLRRKAVCSPDDEDAEQAEQENNRKT
jgi:hypothetical protein